MSHDDPFTIDLFGNTALSSGLGLGVTAFGSDFEPDDDPDPTTPAPALPIAAVVRPSSPAGRARGLNFHLADDRGLARSWKDRARDNIAAIRLAAEIEAGERPATREEQETLIRFTGFGASDLANGVFRRPGEPEFRKGWDEIGSDLEDAVGETDYASLARCTPVCPFHPGVHRPGDLVWPSASRMARGPGAGAGDRYGPVSGADAGSAS